MEKIAIQITANDHVATATDEFAKDDCITISGSLSSKKIKAKEHIPIGHKISIQDITESSEILKYNEVIGIATSEIKAGERVHTHNCWGIKGRRNHSES